MLNHNSKLNLCISKTLYPNLVRLSGHNTLQVTVTEIHLFLFIHFSWFYLFILVGFRANKKVT